MKSEDNQQEAVNAQVSINSENQISGLYCLNKSTGNSICKLIVVNKILNQSNPSKNSLILKLIFLPLYIYSYFVREKIYCLTLIRVLNLIFF